MNQVPNNKNPILWREQISVAHSGLSERLFGGLLGMGVVLLFLGGLGFVTMHIMQTSLFGQIIPWDYVGRIFCTLVVSIAESAMIVFFLPPFIAGAISGERKRGTLDLLFITPLTIRQILWGKLRSVIPSMLRMIGWMSVVLVCVQLNYQISVVDILVSQLIIFVTAVFVLLLTFYISSLLQRTAVVLSVTHGIFIAVQAITYLIGSMAETAFGEMFHGLNLFGALLESFFGLREGMRLPSVFYIACYALISYGLYNATERRMRKLANR